MKIIKKAPKNNKTIFLSLLFTFVICFFGWNIFVQNGSYNKLVWEGQDSKNIYQPRPYVYPEIEILPKNQLKEVLGVSQAGSNNKVVFEKIVLGKSVHGRDIYGYLYGQGSETILLFGGIHGGTERSSAELMDKLITEISNGVVAVGSGKRVIIIPRVNPDGYYERNDKLNANGANLNLNFDTVGWKDHGGDNNTFAGTYPFSEPESQVLRDTIIKYNPSKVISFHSKGSLVNPENYAFSKDFARWYASQTIYGYYYSTAWDYPGTATRWFCEKFEKPAITVELTSHSSIDWNINKGSLANLLK